MSNLLGPQKPYLERYHLDMQGRADSGEVGEVSAYGITVPAWLYAEVREQIDAAIEQTRLAYGRDDRRWIFRAKLKEIRARLLNRRLTGEEKAHPLVKYNVTISFPMQGPSDWDLAVVEEWLRGKLEQRDAKIQIVQEGEGNVDTK